MMQYTRRFPYAILTSTLSPSEMDLTPASPNRSGHATGVRTPRSTSNNSTFTAFKVVNWGCAWTYSLSYRHLEIGRKNKNKHVNNKKQNKKRSKCITLTKQNIFNMLRYYPVKRDTTQNSKIDKNGSSHSRRST